MQTKHTPVVNRGARILPIPFATAVEVETYDWVTTTTTLRRPTDKQRIAMIARKDWFAVGRGGACVGVGCFPIVATINAGYTWDDIPMSA